MLGPFGAHDSGTDLAERDLELGLVHRCQPCSFVLVLSCRRARFGLEALGGGGWDSNRRAFAKRSAHPELVEEHAVFRVVGVVADAAGDEADLVEVPKGQQRGLVGHVAIDFAPER